MGPDHRRSSHILQFHDGEGGFRREPGLGEAASGLRQDPGRWGHDSLLHEFPSAQMGFIPRGIARGRHNRAFDPPGFQEQENTPLLDPGRDRRVSRVFRFESRGKPGSQKQVARLTSSGYNRNCPYFIRRTKCERRPEDSMR